MIPEIKLPLPVEVYIFDDEQPLTNPKEQWLLVGKFNERTCARLYITENMKRYKYIKKMKMKFDNTEEIFDGPLQ